MCPLTSGHDYSGDDNVASIALGVSIPFGVIAVPLLIYLPLMSTKEKAGGSATSRHSYNIVSRSHD